MRCRFLLLLTLSLSLSLRAQKGFQKLISDFEVYHAKNFQEKIFVHTDRTFYLTGDYIWLKVYMINGVDHKPSSLSKVAYVEILDTENTPVLQSKIALHDGIGYTALFLPSTFNSGYYTLRAYTRWMRNFTEDMFFSKTISIVNTFKPQEKTPITPEASLDVQFFPEGGDLITSLKSKVAFRIVDHNGNGITRSGFIINQHADTVARLEPSKFGLGSFYFTPLENETYRAAIRDLKGATIQKLFPTSKSQGYVMNLTEDGERITIKIQTNIGLNDSIHLFVHTRTKVKQTISRKLLNGEASFAIDRNNLDPGISHLTIFDKDIRPVCERLYFKQPSELLTINASFNRKLYPKRKKVIVNVETHSENPQNQSADLSVSVYRLDSLQQEDPINIKNYILLSSDLSGNIESPSYYFSNDQGVKEAADNLMLTHGWRRFHWKDIFEDKKELLFIPEYRGHIITGNIKNDITKENAENILVYLSVPGKLFHLRGSRSNPEGELNFELNDFYGANRVIAQPNTSLDSIYTIRIANPFADKYSEVSLPPFYLGSEYKDPLLKRSISMQMENAYHKSDRIRKRQTFSDSLNFYRVPDAHYNLDGYTRFSVMEDVMREYIHNVFVKKQNKDFSFSMVNSIARLENKDFKMSPMILMDGVPVFNTNTIMNYDPLKVKTIDVVTQRYFYGSLTLNGIVSYSTYSGDLKDFPLDKKAMIEPYNGMEWEREFFSPVYEVSTEESNRVPDYRDLLYWSPHIKTDKNGKAQITFYTSDEVGQYLMNIQGLTADGNLGNASYKIRVEDQGD